MSGPVVGDFVPKFLVETACLETNMGKLGWELFVGIDVTENSSDIHSRKLRGSDVIRINCFCASSDNPFD